MYHLALCLGLSPPYIEGLWIREILREKTFAKRRALHEDLGCARIQCSRRKPRSAKVFSPSSSFARENSWLLTPTTESPKHKQTISSPDGRSCRLLTADSEPWIIYMSVLYYPWFVDLTLRSVLHASERYGLAWS